MKTKFTFFLNMVILIATLFTSCSKDSNGDNNNINLDLYTYVPDDNFEQLLIKAGYDDKMDNYVLTSKIINVKLLLCTSGFETIICDPSGIRNFTGIEDFVALESFDCSNLGLSKLDLSKNINLKFLDCSNNNLTSLDLSNLNLLEGLRCSYNKLTDLKLNSSSLQGLSCSVNSLTTLDLSNTNNLQTIDCFDNNLTNLDISNTIGLKSLQTGSNQITNLDISNNTALTYLECNNNPLTCVKVNEAQLNNDWTFCSKDLFSLTCN